MTYLCLLVAPEKDADGKITCPCCGETRTPHEEDMSKFCFGCFDGNNVHCPRCLEQGIAYTKFREDNPIAHVINTPPVDGVYTAICGTATIRYEQMTGWGAPGTRFCGTCSPDMKDFEWA